MAGLVTCSFLLTWVVPCTLPTSGHVTRLGKRADSTEEGQTQDRLTHTFFTETTTGNRISRSQNEPARSTNDNSALVRNLHLTKTGSVLFHGPKSLFSTNNKTDTTENSQSSIQNANASNNQYLDRGANTSNSQYLIQTLNTSNNTFFIQNANASNDQYLDRGANTSNSQYLIQNLNTSNNTFFIPNTNASNDQYLDRGVNTSNSQYLIQNLNTSNTFLIQNANASNDTFLDRGANTSNSQFTTKDASTSTSTPSTKFQKTRLAFIERDETSTSDFQNQEYLLIDSYILKMCLHKRDEMRVEATHLEVQLNYHPLNRTVSSGDNVQQSCTVALLVPKGKVVKVQVVRFQSTCDNDWGLQVVEQPSGDIVLDVCKSTSIAGEFVLTRRVEVKMLVARYKPYLKNDMESYFVHLHMTAVPQATELELSKTDHNKGIVQTPRWDGQVHYPHNMNSQVVLKVPPGHVVMLSFPFFRMGKAKDCAGDNLKLYIEHDEEQGKARTPEMEQFCGGSSPVIPPRVINTTALRFRFVSNTGNQYEGFRAFFSFHEAASIPEKTEGGLWNCSVPHWPDFKQHFPCNVEVNCAGSEDEEDCPYITEACGKGVISAGDGCYLLQDPGQQSMTFPAMQTECQRRDGYLASLNTPREWTSVWNVLQHGSWRRVMLGLQPARSLSPNMYRDTFVWADKTVAFYLVLNNIQCGEMCVFFQDYFGNPELSSNSCYIQQADSKYLCELDKKQHPVASTATIQLTKPSREPIVSLVQCPFGHMTHDFLACDVRSDCWVRDADNSSCRAPPGSSLPAHFRCATGVGDLPYSLVCDHIQDCSDGSDEDFCWFPACVSGEFRCRNGQCVSTEKLCDGQQRCRDDSHKEACMWKHKPSVKTPLPPKQVDLDAQGSLTVHENSKVHISNGTITCPETHFRCAEQDYHCLPVYLRCNGMNDCPGKEDEVNCHGYDCVGFYRCLGSKVCVHPDHMCDGLFQCPGQDDELLCDVQCPNNCTYYGLAFTCTAAFVAGDFPGLRYLDARGTFMTFLDVENNSMLIHLSLAECDLTFLPYVTFLNLRSLDLSDNLIVSVNGSHLLGLFNLQSLSLAGNPLSHFQAHSGSESYMDIRTLDLSRCALAFLNVENMAVFRNTRELNLSDSVVDEISEAGFGVFAGLQTLDVRGCPVSLFPRGVLKGLNQLRRVYADNYKLCCPATLPVGFPASSCDAQSDEVSSCDTLLRSDFFRMFLYVFAVMSLFGNAGSFVYRVFVSKGRSDQGFGVFVTHLCVSDFLMGVYLTTIGVVDRMYQGAYLWEDVRWRNSVACKTSGFLSLLSCEVSAFIICLITLDRFLVLRFPFSDFHFKQNSARIACGLSWLAGLLLALVPLLPVTRHWEFYKQTSICIPLPVTRQQFRGLAYSFGVMIVLNSVLFLLIAAGQAVIYHSIRINSITMADTSRSSSKDLAIARRLITIAMSDFLCWFPIGFLGVLASQNVPVPGEVNVALAIFMLPLNSALNPFLYTLNIIRERRQKAQFKRLQTLFQSQVQQKRTCTSGIQQRSAISDVV